MKLGEQTIVIERAGAPVTDAHGNPEPSWDAPTTVTVEGCSVQPLVGQEVAVGRETVVSRWTLYAPPTVDLVATDRVVHAGNTYDVDGDVQRWDFGALSHVVALLRRSSSS